MGVNTYLRRIARRVPATYALACDAKAPAPARWLAGLVSAYERAPLLPWLHEILVLPMFLDWLPLWLARRVAFALAGHPRGDDDPAFEGREPPSSGWAGSLLVLLVWTGFLLVCLFLLAVLFVQTGPV